MGHLKLPVSAGLESGLCESPVCLPPTALLGPAPSRGFKERLETTGPNRVHTLDFLLNLLDLNPQSF